MAFYHQHPEYLGVMPGELKASNRLRERLALAAMARVGSAHLRGTPPPEALTLAPDMRLPMVLVQDTLAALMDAGFVARVEDPATGYVPARDMGSIRLSDILASVRSAHEHRELVPDNLPGDPAVEALMGELEDAAQHALGGRTLRDLLDGQDDTAPEPARMPLKRAR